MLVLGKVSAAKLPVELCRCSILFMAAVLLRSAIDVKTKANRDRASRGHDINGLVIALDTCIWLSWSALCRTGSGSGHCPLSVSNLTLLVLVIEEILMNLGKRLTAFSGLLSSVGKGHAQVLR